MAGNVNLGVLSFKKHCDGTHLSVTSITLPLNFKEVTSSAGSLEKAPVLSDGNEYT
jgi:hypothetical protein